VRTAGEDAADVQATGAAALQQDQASQRTGVMRWFFLALAFWCAVLGMAGFGPSYVAYLQDRSTYPPIIHVHGAIMMAWLVAYAAQAVFAMRANKRTHKKVGRLAMIWAIVIWLAMGAVTLLMLRRLDPAVYQFMIQPLLIQFSIMVLFPFFVLWGYLARRDAGWHKRMLTFATFVLVQAALDRLGMLPNSAPPHFWDSALRLYVLLLAPLVAFDLVTMRRPHLATLVGGAILVAAHAVVTSSLTDPQWVGAANAFWAAVR
jgi:cytochrome bd-type quinol oxidase subunit 2